MPLAISASHCSMAATAGVGPYTALRVMPSALRATRRSSPARRACWMTFEIVSLASPRWPAICWTMATRRQALPNSACASCCSSSGMTVVVSSRAASLQLPDSPLCRRTSMRASSADASTLLLPTVFAPASASSTTARDSAN